MLDRRFGWGCAIHRVMSGSALAVLAFLTFLTLCAHASESSEAGSQRQVGLKLSAMAGGSALAGKEAKSINDKVERAVVEDFLKKNPDVSMIPYEGLRLAGASAEAGVTMAMAGGSAGDVLYVNFRTMDQFVGQNFLYPLDEYVVEMAREARGLAPGTPLAFEDVRPEDVGVQPAIWQVICRRGIDGKRHIYSFPKATVVMALMYRKDLFRAAGLDPERPPKDWGELFAYCQKLADPGKKIYGFGIDNWGWHFINFLWQGGTEVVVEDDQGVWKAVFNDQGAVDTLRYLRKLMNTEKTSTTIEEGGEDSGPIAKVELFDDLAKSFGERRCAMMFGYTTELLLASGDIQPEVIGLAALPAGPAGRANEINAAMWGISSQVTSKATRDAAWRFIRHQCSDDAKRISTQTFIQAGYANMVNPTLLQKFGFEQYLDMVSDAWKDANVQAFKSGKPEPYGKNCQHIYAELFAPLDLVMHDRDAKSKVALVPGTPAYIADEQWLKNLLDRAVEKTNSKLLGVVPPEQMKRQRSYAWVILVAVVGVFLFAAWKFMRSFEVPSAADTVSSTARGWRHHLRAWMFLFAAIASIAVWSYYPLLKGSVMAFQDYHVLGNSHWVGLDNFIEAWNQEDFWIGVRVTFLYVILSLGAGFFAPIILAILLHEVPKGKVFFRVLYYLPAVISGLITMFLWKSFFDPTKYGMLNQLLSPLGSATPKAMVVVLALFTFAILAGAYQYIHESATKRPPQTWVTMVAGAALTVLAGMWGWDWVASMWDKAPPFKWLQDPDTSLLCVIIPGVWAGAGPGCLIYLAALKGIPDDIYEAAELDGAGPLRKIWNITLPSLKPLIIINFVGAFIGAFHAMQNIFVMSGSGPLKSTHTLSLEIWMSAFMHLKYGYATAIAWILGAMLIGFTVWQLKILKDLKFTTNK
ncbi:MAG: extracellular solute-binding protein [Planctomycetes bacterium]|nr:extracellular solute-binding protein [Planctomycetota bacterium]